MHLRAIGDWLAAHPLWLAFFTLVVGGLISVFSSDIRAFAKIPPQRLGRWVLKARLKSAIGELDHLRSMKAEKLEVLIDLGGTLMVVLSGMFLLVIVIICSIIIPTRVRDLADYIGSLGGSLVVIIGLVSHVRTTVKLNNFARYEMRLRQKIMMLEQRIETKYL